MAVFKTILVCSTFNVYAKIQKAFLKNNILNYFNVNVNWYPNFKKTAESKNSEFK